MEHSEDLARLEQFVEKLIDSHNQLKSENDEIYAQLQDKEHEIMQLQETVKDLQEDRSVMHTRVTGLIDRIDKWDKKLVQDDQVQNSDSGERDSQKMSKKSSSLFNVRAEQPSESAI